MLKGSDGLMSLALSSDGKGRSGSGETQARPKVAGPKQLKYQLFHNLNESLFSSWGVSGPAMKW